MKLNPALIGLITAAIFSLSGKSFAIEVAITVDDLPAHGDLPAGQTRLGLVQSMLKSFKNHSIPEVYGFVNGVKVERDPDLREVLDAWLGAGYPVANHTFSHADLRRIPVTEYLNDIIRDEPLLRSLNGALNFHWFRFPFLLEGATQETRDSIRLFLSQNGYQTAQVTIDFGDWAWNEPYARCLASGDASSIQKLTESYLNLALTRLAYNIRLSRAIADRDIKHILLLHAGGFTEKLLPALLSEYERHGVSFISLSAATSDPIYRINPNILSSGGMTFLDQLKAARAIQMDGRGKIPTELMNTLCNRKQASAKRSGIRGGLANE